MPEPNELSRSYENRIPRGRIDIHNKFTGDRIHVAAVCYRVKGDEPEFLLVRTRGGRWTFPAKFRETP